MKHAARTTKIVRLVFACGLLAFTLYILTRGGFSPLHTVDLVFHEAGHIIFMPFGETMHILGGTLGQLLVPLICLIAFLRQDNPYAAAVMSWWIGENLVDISLYISDATAQALPLLGGSHDWTALLSMYDILAYDVFIGKIILLLGVILMFGALAWAITATLRAKDPRTAWKRSTYPF